MKRSKGRWLWLGIGALFLIAMAVACMFFRLPSRHLREPMMVLVYYTRNPELGIRQEEAYSVKLSDIPAEPEVLDRLSRYHSPPATFWIGDEDSNSLRNPLAFNAVCVADNGGVRSYRVNIIENLVKCTFADIDYNNEKYLTIARGEDWYLAITR